MAPDRYQARHAARHSGLVSRRVALGAALVTGLGIASYEALSRGVPAARRLVNDVEGCGPDSWTCSDVGTNVSGEFYSRFRQRRVGYTVGYPAGHGPGSALPLIVFLHGFHGTHWHSLPGYSPSSAVSTPGVRPMALVTVDGGNGYWHPHPGDDPMGMVMHELIPKMQRQGLGTPELGLATMGISMGGYGAIAFAEHFPTTFRAVAAISPAIFVTYEWVHYVNPGAYWSAADFARYDAVTHAAALAHTPVRVASGSHDPFHPWVEEFADRLPPSDPVVFPPGAHTGSFFQTQIAPSVRFISRWL